MKMWQSTSRLFGNDTERKKIIRCNGLTGNQEEERGKAKKRGEVVLPLPHTHTLLDDKVLAGKDDCPDE